MRIVLPYRGSVVSAVAARRAAAAAQHGLSMRKLRGRRLMAVERVAQRRRARMTARAQSTNWLILESEAKKDLLWVAL